LHVAVIVSVLTVDLSQYTVTCILLALLNFNHSVKAGYPGNSTIVCRGLTLCHLLLMQGTTCTSCYRQVVQHSPEWAWM